MHAKSGPPARCRRKRVRPPWPPDPRRMRSTASRPMPEPAGNAPRPCMEKPEGVYCVHTADCPDVTPYASRTLGFAGPPPPLPAPIPPSRRRFADVFPGLTSPVPSGPGPDRENRRPWKTREPPDPFTAGRGHPPRKATAGTGSSGASGSAGAMPTSPRSAGSAAGSSAAGKSTRPPFRTRGPDDRAGPPAALTPRNPPCRRPGGGDRTQSHIVAEHARLRPR